MRAIFASILFVLFCIASKAEELPAGSPTVQAQDQQLEPTPSPAPDLPSKRLMKPSVLVGIFGGSKFKSGYKLYDFAALQTYEGDIEYKFKNAVSIGFDYGQFDKNRWNNGVRAEYLNVEADTVAVSGALTMTGNASGSISILSVAYSGNYRADQIYFPVGIGLASGSYSGSIALLKDVKPLAVAWLGVGVAASENIQVELQSRAYSLRNGKVETATYSILPNEATTALSGYQLSVRIGW